MLLAAALCLKIFVPTGYMPSAQGGALTVELCSGSAPAGSKVLIHVERKGGSHDASNTADHPCAFPRTPRPRSMPCFRRSSRRPCCSSSSRPSCTARWRFAAFARRSVRP
jgi:hypothetical protein